METELRKQERWNRYNLHIGDVVWVKSLVQEIGPNCMVKVLPWDECDHSKTYKTHRNMIINYDKGSFD
jgi:hypothetical protein